MIKLSVLEHGYIKEGFTVQDALREATELAQYTESLGYQRFWVSEHHGMPALSFSSPEVMIAHLASHTSRIRIGSGGIMLPHYSAYKVAENFRLLEALYPDRIDIGIGRATGAMPMATAALNEGKRLNVQQFPVQIEDLIGYLYEDLDEEHRFAKLKAIPLIDTVPELWVLGSSSEGGKIAAKHGVSYAFAQFFGVPGGEEAIHHYKTGFEPSLVRETPRAMITLSVICADTEEEARSLAASNQLYFLALMRGGQLEAFPSQETALNYSYSAIEKEQINSRKHLSIVGDPEQVKKGILRISEFYNVDEIMVASAIHDFEARKKSFQLIAEVMKEEEQ
ncbi:LLM class flavin-dependent oxidoreductase [Neobacillus mesonae]|nr:LLM class flavin-dependent oxidoreductase [Neobacillus mesonae]